MSAASFWLLYLACACLTAAVHIYIFDRYWSVIERELGVGQREAIARVVLVSLIWPFVWLNWCIVFFHFGRRP